MNYKTRYKTALNNLIKRREEESVIRIQMSAILLELSETNNAYDSLSAGMEYGSDISNCIDISHVRELADVRDKLSVIYEKVKRITKKYSIAQENTMWAEQELEIIVQSYIKSKGDDCVEG